MSTREYPNTPRCSGEILKRFEPTARETDVFVVTHPKCGQTWLCCLLYHLKTKGKSPDLEGKGIMGAIAWLEMPMNVSNADLTLYDVDERMKELESLEDPRIFKMHVTAELVPRPPGHKSKVIVVTRDPREIPYSFYKHKEGSNIALFGLPNGVHTFEDFFDGYIEKEFFFVPFVQSFWPHRTDDNLLWLRYEDMKQDIRGCADRILSFLGWHATEDEIQKAIELSEFQRMREIERSVLFPHGNIIFRSDSSFIREGSIGRNRSKLTKDMEDRLMEKLEKGLQSDAKDFIFHDA